MAKRLTGERTVDSDAVQGKGSWVKIKALRLKQMRRIRKQQAAEGEDFDNFEAGLDLLREHVADWNWVDDDGQRLPSPADDPDVLDDLTDQEVDFLTNLIAPGEEELKN